MAGRTWVIAPDAATLEARWDRLVAETDPVEKERLFHPQLRKGKVASRHIRKVVEQSLGMKPTRQVAILADNDTCEAAIRYGFRSFDREWLIADARLLNDARPVLWNAHSNRQLYLTAPDDISASSGPALTFTDLIPDLHHYNGRGGRVCPLWKDRAGTESNIKPALLVRLAKIYGHEVKAEDMMAYLAAIMAHPAFTARFAADLRRPGLRVPLTANADLFAEAAGLGSEVIWLHTYGERFADPKAGRPKHAPRLPKEIVPHISAAGAIPPAPEPLPDIIDYDPATRRLKVGDGYVENVTPEMWTYEVSGKHVVWEWFSDRQRDRSKPLIADKRPPSPLDSIQPAGWLAEYTTDLLDLLNVLGRLIALEPAQANLLDRICAGHLITHEELEAAGALKQPEAKPFSSAPKVKTKKKDKQPAGE
ncbi:MAG: type ISP restriction/modification enzyme [Alphaproteobacteria bacterium]